DGAIPRQRSRFLTAAAGAYLVRPRQAKPTDVGCIDLFERAVAGLSQSQTVGEPVLPSAPGVFQRRVVDAFGLLGCEDYAHKSEEKGADLSNEHRRLSWKRKEIGDG